MITDHSSTVEAAHVHSFPYTYFNRLQCTAMGRNKLIFENLCSIRSSHSEANWKKKFLLMPTRSAQDWAIEIYCVTNSWLNRTVAELNPSSSIIIYWEQSSTWSELSTVHIQALIQYLFNFSAKLKISSLSSFCDPSYNLTP